MTKKGCIGYTEGKKAKLYYPKIKKTDAATAETENLIERIYQGSVSLMMSTLVKKKNFSKEEIRELYDILKEMEDKYDWTHFYIHNFYTGAAANPGIIPQPYFKTAMLFPVAFGGI